MSQQALIEHFYVPGVVLRLEPQSWTGQGLKELKILIVLFTSSTLSTLYTKPQHVSGLFALLKSILG